MWVCACRHTGWNTSCAVGDFAYHLGLFCGSLIVHTWTINKQHLPEYKGRLRCHAKSSNVKDALCASVYGFVCAWVHVQLYENTCVGRWLWVTVCITGNRKTQLWLWGTHLVGSIQPLSSRGHVHWSFFSETESSSPHGWWNEAPFGTLPTPPVSAAP